MPSAQPQWGSREYRYSYNDYGNENGSQYENGWWTKPVREPAWHRRQRSQRANDRAYIRLAKSKASLNAHHSNNSTDSTKHSARHFVSYCTKQNIKHNETQH